MKTCLIFVLSVNAPPYAQMMRNSMDTWDSEACAGTETVYYHGNPMVQESLRVVSFPVDEDYKTISRKNLLAFEWALRKPWDYMARVNASCYVHKQRLVEHVQTLPGTGLIRGVCTEPTPFCGVSRGWMWGGAQFILSRDVVEAIVANPDKMRHDVMEDVALGEIAQDLGYKLDGDGRCCSLNRTPEGGWMIVGYGGGPSFVMKEPGDIPEHFFFRVKNDADRGVDRENMLMLKQNLLP